ncbi:transposase domain-containing protein [Streptomyces sp. H27-H1]|uniref:transposase domain-containing protein n=1 Tax=Streptomyces sp. H27-H1 TaxID=2996461 RepID=UPI003B638DC4
MYAPGHLGELTQIVDFALVDAVIDETGSREKRLRLLPSRVMAYFVLALALFENCSYRGVWGKLTAGLEGLPLVRPAVSSLSRARRRIGAAPLRRLFEILAGPSPTSGRPARSTGGFGPWPWTAPCCTCPMRRRSPGAIPSGRARVWSSATR